MEILNGPCEPIQIRTESEDGGRTESSLLQQVAILQERLHAATVQLNQANSECVEQREELQKKSADNKSACKKLKEFHNSNVALKRKVEGYEAAAAGPKVKLPRPGPSLKAFSDLKPRQRKLASNEAQLQVLKTSEERQIQPAKLSAYLTYR